MPRVGEDLVTYCGKCKQRTTHVVFAMNGAQVKRVQCKICLSYHNYHPDPDDRPATGPAGTLAVRRRREGDEAETMTRRVIEDSTSDTDDVPASRAKAKAPPKAPRARKEPAAPDYAELWTQAMNGKDPGQMVDYKPAANFDEGNLVNHPSFGVGVVTRINPMPEKKMQVLFRDGFKTLVCRLGG